MRRIDLIHSDHKDEIAVYLDGVFEETLFHLTIDDMEQYSDGEYIEARVQRANDALEDYLRVHEEWPTRLKYVRDVMES